MFGLIAFVAAAYIVKKMDDASDYKEPKGNNKNRYTDY